MLLDRPLLYGRQRPPEQHSGAGEGPRLCVGDQGLELAYAAQGVLVRAASTSANQRYLTLRPRGLEALVLEQQLGELALPREEIGVGGVELGLDIVYDVAMVATAHA